MKKLAYCAVAMLLCLEVAARNVRVDEIRSVMPLRNVAEDVGISLTLFTLHDGSRVLVTRGRTPRGGFEIEWEADLEEGTFRARRTATTEPRLELQAAGDYTVGSQPVEYRWGVRAETYVRNSTAFAAQQATVTEGWTKWYQCPSDQRLYGGLESAGCTGNSLLSLQTKDCIPTTTGYGTTLLQTGVRANYVRASDGWSPWESVQMTSQPDGWNTWTTTRGQSGTARPYAYVTGKEFVYDVTQKFIDRSLTHCPTTSGGGDDGPLDHDGGIDDHSGGGSWSCVAVRDCNDRLIGHCCGESTTAIAECVDAKGCQD